MIPSSPFHREASNLYWFYFALNEIKEIRMVKYINSVFVKEAIAGKIRVDYYLEKNKNRIIDSYNGVLLPWDGYMTTVVSGGTAQKQVVEFFCNQRQVLTEKSFKTLK